MQFIIIFLVSVFMSASLLITWFNSSLPMLCVWLLTKLGYRKNDVSFHMQYGDNPLMWTRDDWMSYCNQYMSAFWAKLLNCKFCLCWHFCLWSTAYAVLIAKSFAIISWCEVLLLILSIPSQPVIVHFLRKIIEQKGE